MFRIIQAAKSLGRFHCIQLAGEVVAEFAAALHND